MTIRTTLILVAVSLGILAGYVQSQIDTGYVEFLERCFNDSCSNHNARHPSSNSGTGLFYIRLRPKTPCNDTKMPSECKVKSLSEHSPLNCMCGKRLLNYTESFSNMLNSATCPGYRKIRDVTSGLGICEEVFQSLGYCVTLAPYYKSTSVNDIGLRQNGLYNNLSLSRAVSRIESQLQNFFDVIDRTLVGSYFKTAEHRCICLDSYKKWLCASQLESLYVHSEDVTESANSTNCSVQSHTAMTTSSNNDTELHGYRPCLSVCHQVVQACPYYLPSTLQGDGKETVYGGYPAFDCPRAEVVKEMYNTSEYGGTHTYANPSCGQCIGYRSAAVSGYTLHMGAVVLIDTVCVLLFSKPWLL